MISLQCYTEYVADSGKTQPCLHHKQCNNHVGALESAQKLWQHNFARPARKATCSILIRHREHSSKSMATTIYKPSVGYTISKSLCPDQHFAKAFISNVSDTDSICFLDGPLKSSMIAFKTERTQVNSSCL